MPVITRSTTSLTEDTIEKLIDTTITTNNQKHKLVKNQIQEETLEEISKNLKIIKEQNDEIIGDEF